MRDNVTVAGIDPCFSFIAMANASNYIELDSKIADCRSSSFKLHERSNFLGAAAAAAGSIY